MSSGDPLNIQCNEMLIFLCFLSESNQNVRKINSSIIPGSQDLRESPDRKVDQGHWGEQNSWIFTVTFPRKPVRMWKSKSNIQKNIKANAHIQVFLQTQESWTQLFETLLCKSPVSSKVHQSAMMPRTRGHCVYVLETDLRYAHHYENIMGLSLFPSLLLCLFAVCKTKDYRSIPVDHQSTQQSNSVWNILLHLATFPLQSLNLCL